MKRDDVLQIFPDATKEQVDSVLNGIRDTLNPLKAEVKELTSKLESANSELSQSRSNEAAQAIRIEELTEKVEAGMSAEERMAAREQAAADKERAFQLRSNELDAKSIFVEAGFSEEDIKTLLPRVVSDDLEATKAAANSLVEFDTRRREQAERDAKDAVLKANPQLEGYQDGNSMTIDDFFALSDAEQISLKQQNPNILNELFSLE